MDWSNDNCPVCNSGAREALPRMGDFAEIICENCGRYRVSGTALEAIRHEPPEVRHEALRRAVERAGQDGGMPKIMYDDLAKGGADTGGG